MALVFDERTVTLRADTYSNTFCERLWIIFWCNAWCTFGLALKTFIEVCAFCRGNLGAGRSGF